MNPSPECERVRAALMASIDGEPGAPSPSDEPHLTTCAPCRQWLAELDSVAGRLEGLVYRRTQVDLWPAVEVRVHRIDQRASLARLWPIAALVIAWRALQLWVDLPAPVLQPIVPLVAAIWIVWRVTGDPLAIETHAPELQKRGV